MAMHWWFVEICFEGGAVIRQTEKAKTWDDAYEIVKSDNRHRFASGQPAVKAVTVLADAAKPMEAMK